MAAALLNVAAVDHELPLKSLLLKIRNEQTEALMLLMGVVGFVGGLLLWGLGRIECAITPPAKRHQSEG